MAEPRVGAQLIVFGRQQEEDLQGVLAAVARGGYGGFECGVPASEDQVAQVLWAMDIVEIPCAGAHTGFTDWDSDTVVNQRIEFTKRLGASYLITSGSYDWKTGEDYRKAGRIATEAGKRCRDAGISFLYHNHAWEFREFDGVRGIHAFAEASDPESVKLCPDIYWVHVGGERPTDFIARYQSRCPYFHFKDGLGGDDYREFRELGQGKVDIPAALRAALACKPEWIVVEQDASSLEPADSVRISREYLESLGV